MRTGREEGGNYESRGQELSGKQVKKWEMGMGTGREEDRNYESKG